LARVEDPTIDLPKNANDAAGVTCEQVNAPAARGATTGAFTIHGARSTRSSAYAPSGVTGSKPVAAVMAVHQAAELAKVEMPVIYK
jgi:hypothetical protein